jgi:ABC-type transport system involved in multi-copper enzyme maturation permease subunit
LRSRRSAFAWLIEKEWRELLASRAWWVLLCAIGPLVGVSFISAVRIYAEASGLHGTAAGVGEAFSPLIGIWAPTFSGCELAAAFLFPFVTIRLVAGDRQSGALKLELQRPVNAFSRIVAKTIVLLVAWTIASLAPIVAVFLWRLYGGSVYAAELVAVLFGHMLNAGLVVALAAAAASVADHPATAAIGVLTVTVGTWIINFMAAVHGGLWESAAAYTPTAMVAEFQHALVRLNVVLISTAFIIAGLALASIWTRLGIAAKRRVYESMALGVATAAAVFACTFARSSWDLSESRGNSFSTSEEQALRAIRAPLHIQAHFAPEDPRGVDLERRTFSKLRRVMPTLHIRYVSATSIGLFEQTSPHYGEIWYDLDGRTTASRVTTPEGVLETIFSLAGVQPQADESDPIFRGHPLAVPAHGAPLVFYVLWPAATFAGGLLLRRRHT